MNLHFSCVFSLGQAEATLIVPGWLFAVTGAVNKPHSSIPTSLNSVRSALWSLTRKRKVIQKYQLCLPCSLKLCQTLMGHHDPSWWRLLGGTTPVSPPWSRASGPQGNLCNLHTRTAPASPSIPRATEQPQLPLQQQGFLLLSAVTQSTHTFPLLPISVYDSLYPHLVGFNCSNSILVSTGEGSK